MVLERRTQEQQRRSDKDNNERKMKVGEEEVEATVRRKNEKENLKLLRFSPLQRISNQSGWLNSPWENCPFYYHPIREKHVFEEVPT